MAENRFPHIFIKKPQEITDYTSKQSGGGKINIPERNRNQHGNFLKREFKKLWKQSEKSNENRQVKALPFKKGHYLEFRSKTGYDLVTKSLEDIKSGIRLLNINIPKEKQKGNQKITAGTIYVPKDKMSLFLKKIEHYLDKNEDTKPTEKQLEKDPNFKGNPKNKKLVESIEEIRLATLESFWRDDPNLIPKGNESVECEVWLKTEVLRYNAERNLQPNTEIDNFFKVYDQLNQQSTEHINKKSETKFNRDQSIQFPERAVVLIKASKNQLVELIKSCDDIAEFRRAKETARFFLDQENKEQIEWVKDLQKRLQLDEESKVSICLLDTGVNNGHPLIKPVLSDKDCHTVNPNWGTEDKDGHGTKMSGLAIYGDLQKALESRKQINIHHKLESVKLIPSDGTSNDPKLYGHLTKQGISRAEIEKPDRKRTICMAVTSKDDRDKGRPSSWSGAIDQIASGAEDNKKRLLIISAGNVQQEDWKNYPHSNTTNTVHDPAQSWNALTVGAYTDKTSITDEKLKEYKPIAKKGELSPFSSTSVTWETKKWPIKPDVVFEGGNVAKNKIDTTETEDLSLLSLHYKPQERHFEMIHATSAATAQASWLATQIHSKYPKIWPETIRALMVHSSDWKESMIKQFWKHGDSEKNNYKKTLRAFGYGVPNLDKALSSYKNSLTLVSEQIIQPFTKKNSNYTTKDMHFYKMPWPKTVLKNLPDQTVIKFKFTLSYFIEPGPGEIGWKDRYRYPSFGLRFALIQPQESENDFMKRINKKIAEDEEQNKDTKKTTSSGDRWKFGKQNTSLGSIHSDFLEKTTAQEIAHCNCMAVYPSTGWWKERQYLKQYDKKARYSLIISLSTPEEKIDLYTPVDTQIKMPIKT